jgi:hypothetical protein
LANQWSFADLEHLRSDEALYEAEDVRVRSALHLAHEQPLVRREKRSSPMSESPSGRALLAAVERATADHVGVDIPADAFRGPGCFGCIERSRLSVVRLTLAFSRVGERLSTAAGVGGATGDEMIGAPDELTGTPRVQRRVLRQ